MDTIRQDLTYALRGMRRSPAFALVAVLTLALGIGVNSAIFSVVSAILYRPLPVARPAELVNVYGREAGTTAHETHSYPNYLAYREQSATLAGLAAYTNFFAHLSIAGSSDLVVGELVSDNYFEVLGVRPALGRAFTAAEAAAPGSASLAVISDRFWQSRFGGTPDVLGKSFRLNGTVYSIVGVMPPAFGGVMPAVTAQMWIPVAMADQVEPVGSNRVTGRSVGTSRLERRGQHWLWLKGRVRPGTTPDQVQAEFATMVGRLAEAEPETMAKEGVAVVRSADVRFNPDIDATMAPVGLLLLVAVGLVLLVTCANLANLLLARAAGRRREVAVRLALGADRRRLVRQFLTESVLLALAGGVLALPLAVAVPALIGQVQPPFPIDLGLSLAPDWRVLVFTLATSLVTGIAFGLAPALQASRPSLVPALKGGQGRERRRFGLRDALVVVQVAVSLLLVVGGALLVRSLGAAAKVPLGYAPDRTAYLTVALDMSGYDRERGGRFLAAAVQRLQALPQVQQVGLASRLPLSINNNGFSLYVDQRAGGPEGRVAIDGAYIDEGYIDALGLSLVAGRGVEPGDRDGGRRVAVVNRALAQRLWPGPPAEAVGREFRLREQGDPWQVVGVVADYKVDTPGERPTPYLHLPLARQETFGNFVVRTAGPASAIVPVLQRELRAMDPELVFMDRGTMRDLASVRLFPVLAGAWLIGAFGILALGVAAIGLYGVIAYSVSRRTREIGIRKALGARPAQLVGMVLREGMTLVTIGGVIGVAVAAALAPALSSALFVGPFDLPSFGIAFAVLGIAALLANVIPARRASRVDAMVALRSD